ncbi:MAG: low-specificity L-threonine aldolase [Candidatus Melainabacteria bacterium]|nr:low-specificity L-threonine aldolase [Candidatus Melainabacteria bacterium]
MKIIDLRSDTVTMPSLEMRQAIFTAELGDDVYDEDPTVNSLQKRVAKLLGKEDSLFVSSGTMGNLISLLVHCGRGDQAIIGDSSHINLWEQNGASSLGGISLRTLPNNADGTISISAIESAINPDNIHCAKTKLICLENTWNGHPISLDYIEQVKTVANQHRLKMHIDGARMFNACLALNVTPAQLVENFDSVQFCFSKGLAAPIGSMVCGNEEFIYEAKRMRKVLGGAMRQIGIAAAACHVALDKMIDRLPEDHESAKKFADGLAKMSHIKVDSTQTKTNMVFFDSALPGVSRVELQQQLLKNGILVGIEQRLGIRAVTHYGVSNDDIDEALGRIQKLAPISGQSARV